MHTFDDSTPTTLPRATLVPLTGSQSEPINLSKTLTLVGSGTGVHICLQTRTVEEFHAAILTSDRHVYVRDLGTLGGMLVNGQRVRDAVLRDGDELQFGKVAFRFDGGAARSALETVAGDEAELCAGPTIHWLSDRVTLIGRGPRCDLRLEDDLSFEKHAVVYWADGSWRVRILTPGPGTLLNERSVRRARLHPGDVLIIGRTEVLFRPGRGNPAAVAPSASAGVESPPVRDEAVNVAPPTPARRTSIPSSTAPTVASGDNNFIRDWGPVAAAMATVTSPDEDIEVLVEQELEGESPARNRRWIIGTVVSVIVLATALVGIFIWLRD